MNLHKRLKRIFMTRQGRIDEAIQKHGAMNVLEAGNSGIFCNYESLRAMGITSSAAKASIAAYRQLTAAELDSFTSKQDRMCILTHREIHNDD